LNSSSVVCGHKGRKSWQSQKLSHCSILPRTFAVPRRTLVSNEATFCCSSLRCRCSDRFRSLRVTLRHTRPPTNLLGWVSSLDALIQNPPLLPQLRLTEHQGFLPEGRLVPSNSLEGVLDETGATA
jgi:hypothetical protein